MTIIDLSEPADGPEDDDEDDTVSISAHDDEYGYDITINIPRQAIVDKIARSLEESGDDPSKWDIVVLSIEPDVIEEMNIS